MVVAKGGSSHLLASIFPTKHAAQSAELDGEQGGGGREGTRLVLEQSKLKGEEGRITRQCR